MRFDIPRQRRNGKLAQRQGSKRRWLKDKVYFPVAGQRSRLRDQWRVALKERNQLEREALWANHPHRDEVAAQLGWPTHRLEEGAALKLLAGVPTIWAILEKNNPHYRRPVWADQRFGSR